MDLKALLDALPPEAIAALKAGNTKATKTTAKATNTTKATYTRPFRELTAPPIVEPRRAGPVTGQRLALDRFTAKAFAAATYGPEHMLGQFPPIGARGADIAHLLGV